MIIRIKKKDRFAIIDKGILDDPRLSYKATGLLAYLLSKPDNWEVSMEQLAKAKKDGKIAVRTAMRELKEFGYVEQLKIKIDGTGKWKWIHIVNEVPTIKSLVEKGSRDPKPC